jgi:hypothetical protein
MGEADLAWQGLKQVAEKTPGVPKGRLRVAQDEILDRFEKT